MITRENLNGKTNQEIQKLMEEDVNAFGAELMTIESEEEVLHKEEELMKLMDENKEYINSVVYPVSDSCEFDKQVFNKETVCDYIVDFLNTQEIEWSYTLGLYELVKVWKNKKIETISYGAYDSTLRILGQLKYKGHEAWKKILTINSFLTPCHDEYTKDTAYVIYLTQLHNTIIEALKKFNPEAEEPTELPA